MGSVAPSASGIYLSIFLPIYLYTYLSTYLFNLAWIYISCVWGRLFCWQDIDGKRISLQCNGQVPPLVPSKRDISTQLLIYYTIYIGDVVRSTCCVVTPAGRISMGSVAPSGIYLSIFRPIYRFTYLNTYLPIHLAWIYISYIYEKGGTCWVVTPAGRMSIGSVAPSGATAKYRP